MTMDELISGSLAKGLGGDCLLAILGQEHQSKIHYQMPLRTMENEYLNYARQVQTLADRHRENREYQGHTEAEYLSRFLKSDRLIPCISLVIYWGQEPWDGPTCLADMFAGNPWTKYASDYKMHLLQVCRMTEEELDAYSPNLRAVFGFVRYAESKEELRRFLEKNEEAFSNISDTAVCAIAELAHSPELEELVRIRELEEEEEREGTDMCRALRELIEEGREKGREEGRTEGVLAEQQNTERERLRAEQEGRRAEQESRRAEQEMLRAEAAEKKLREMEKELAGLKLRLQMA